MPEGDLQAVADALAQAEADRAADLERLAEMSEDEVAYLAGAETLEDPDSDGLEVDCI